MGRVFYSFLIFFWGDLPDSMAAMSSWKSGTPQLPDHPWLPDIGVAGVQSTRRNCSRQVLCPASKIADPKDLFWDTHESQLMLDDIIWYIAAAIYIYLADWLNNIYINLFIYTMGFWKVDETYLHRHRRSDQISPGRASSMADQCRWTSSGPFFSSADGSKRLAP